ncbi:LysR family transcriptional regulator [Pacificispira sp.]|uniref:LysR family transcriptional regulator n=1 Tax=Pacificispira sp. TaxID=2888761 RepID=UPI003B520842
MDRFTLYQLFVRVAEVGSFTAVGRECGMSQSSVSRAVSLLEQRCGSQLLQRTTRRVSLTETGVELYERSRALLSEIEDLESSIGNRSKSPVGRLRLQAPTEFGRLHVSGHVMEFLAAYPGIDVDLTLNDRYVDLIEEGVDLAIRIGNLSDQSMIAKKLGQDSRHLVASPSYLERHGEPAHPGELMKHSCVIYTYQRTPERWLFSGPDGVVEVTVSGRVRANSGEVMRSAVLSGHGIAILGGYSVRHDISAGRLVALLPGYPIQPLDVQIIYSPTRHLSRKSRAFIDFYADRIRHSGVLKGASSQ